MCNDTLTGVRRQPRGRVFSLALLGVAVSGGVAMSSPASAAFNTQNAFLSAPAVTVKPAAVRILPVALPAPRVPTTTAVWADRRSVRAGEKVQLTGQVTHGSAANRIVSRPVVLQVRAGDNWRDVATANTVDQGYVAFTVTPSKSSTYRLAYHGASDFSESLSGDLTIQATSAPRPPAAPKTTVKPPAANAPAAASGTAARVVSLAAAQSGKPYRFGAAGPDAFDCSGFTQYVFGSVGVNLPHNADAQKGYGVAVSRANAQPGDLIVFLDGGYGYHAAIYAGGDSMYDAPNAGSSVGKRAIYSGTVVFRRLI